MIKLPKIIGHRGAKDLVPENTLDSIKESIRHKIKWVEVDVKISKDKIPFLLHDDLLDRTTNGKGYPYNYVYKEILNFDAGSWFNKKFNYIYPPTLEEVIVFCLKYKIGLNIEMKPNKGKEKENVKAIINLIKKYKSKLKYYISSFDYYSLKLIRKQIPDCDLCYLADSFDINLPIKSFIKDSIKINCFSVGVNKDLITSQFIKICKKNNLKITTYSYKNISFKIAIELWNKGVNTIFIDNPIKYKKILK